MSGQAAGIAVIGMSCRFPDVHSPAEFWQLLVEGKSTIGTFPPQRAADAHTRHLSHPDAATLDAGSFLDRVDTFDAGFFDIAPAEAAAMDPVQRLGLELAWEAVEDAGMPAGALAGRDIDVVVGAAPSGYDLLRRHSGSDRDDHYAALGSSGALIANRISHLFDARGMSLCADSGQSSSLVSLALTCERIHSGAVDLAIAGGVHLITDPETGAGLANLGALSPEGNCFPFDERANGFVRGEGGAFVVLKHLDQALADGDHVYAVIRGWGVAGAGATSRMPDPSPTGQAAAVRAALTRAGLDLTDIDYVETHGTGTRLGDPAEASGLRQAGAGAGRERPLVLGAVKANVGHLEPAAGIVGFVKAALCVERGRLPAQPGFGTPNPAIADFDRDFEVLRAPRPWPGTPQRPRRAGVSSIGMGGTNAHLVLEQAPHSPAPSRQPEPEPAAADAAADADVDATVPWVLSAHGEQALRAQAARLRDQLAGTPWQAADVGHALAATRTAFTHRAVLLTTGRTDALAGLDDLAAGTAPARGARGVSSGETGPVVFVFPGQGSQWPAMGRQLYAQSEVFARAVDDCAKALAPWVDWSLVDVVTGAPGAASLERVDVIQPALFAMMVSLARLWRSLGVVPDAVVGHSQGEIAAACVSGALSLPDAAQIVARRSQCLSELAGLGGMSAVAAPADWVTQRLRHWPGRLSVAAFNGPQSVVISGDDEALEQFAKAAADDQVRVRRIKVDYASHSHHVERIQAQVLEAAAGVSPRSSTVAFHSTVTGQLLDTRTLDGAYWYDNLRSPVRFADVVDDLMRTRPGVFVEVSPHPVLQVAMEERADTLAAPPLVVGTLSKHDGSLGKVWGALAQLYVRGVPADWTALFAAARPRRITLPTYPFQRQRYWLSAPTGPADDPTGPTPHNAAAGLDSPADALALVSAETATLLTAKGVQASGPALQARADETFKTLGFDSATAVELRNRLHALTGVRLPATVAFTYPTPRRLAQRLLDLLHPAVPDTPATTTPGKDAEHRDEAAAHSDDDLYALIERGYV
ncbi:type I polyketide synthase [Streptomyces sp. NPDC002952]|uniref:type I polyketide synthase n=1 Tax=Streptomyces sp. NPDC002952 TaxID=3364673 RepID=UPI0036D0AD70